MNKIEKLINKYLNFLVTDFNLSYKLQKFNEFKGFCGPVYAYSFYNDKGCFTIHYIAQRDEIGFYKSKNISPDQNLLMENEINLTEYISPAFRKSTIFKRLSASIRNQIRNKKSFFGLYI